MVLQCGSCEKVFYNLSEVETINECLNCKSGNIIIGYIDDKMIPVFVKTQREDGQINCCVIEMPQSYLEADKFDDTYDELISEKIEDKIYFDGLGYNIIETKEFNKALEQTHKYKIIIHEEHIIEAQDEDEAYEKYFEEMRKNNETAETRLTDLMKIERVEKNV